MRSNRYIFPFLLILFVASQSFSQALPNQKLFNHALETPDSVLSNYRDLVQYLSIPVQSDRELVETIFYWLAIHIQYVDDPDYETGHTDSIAITTLRSGKSGCEGTARLFHELCKKAGIGSELIFGYALGSSTGDERISNPNHGWNAVKLDDKWELLDATWGSGGSFKSAGTVIRVKEMDMRYLFADPNDFIIDHYPEEKQWQLLEYPVSKREFFSDFGDIKRMAWHTKYED